MIQHSKDNGTALAKQAWPNVGADRSQELCRRFIQTRSATLRLAEPLQPEDTVIQSMPDASPVKWHLAHTTWFFERFVLRAYDASYRSPDATYDYLFNSYYTTVGPRHCRPRRGVISRPTLDEVLEFRRHVDERVRTLLDGPIGPRLSQIMELGLQHEMQHQELIVTDIKHALSSNPLLPAPYTKTVAGERVNEVAELQWCRFDAGLCAIGATPGDEFGFDNESPRHRVFLEAYEIAHRPVTNAEYRAFIEDGGYARPELWLSLGWAAVEEHGWRCPMYWYLSDGRWYEYTLHRGAAAVRDDEAVCHLSYFEADAYARWAGARLPTEAEWEHAAADLTADGATGGDGRFHPSSLRADEVYLSRFFGDVWEWTSSSYGPYPGYTPAKGALGEYNGKFMCNQYVLRGGSCATPRGQVRLTYRNFFPPDARWQFAGVRLARSVRAERPVLDSVRHGSRRHKGSADRRYNAVMAAGCVRALRETPPRIPTKYLYDAKGSELFERITALPEYTLTRDELNIYGRHLNEMAEVIGRGAWIIELGSGDGRKTRRLLGALNEPTGYTPVEVAGGALRASVAELEAQFPDLVVRPVEGDFAGELTLPLPEGGRRVVYFPGSTIGNFDDDEARRLVRRMARWVGPGGGLLIGLDLVKPADELLRAYSDRAGVTAAFNLNVLDRLNIEAGGDFDREHWSHRASWNAERSRMESDLVSDRAQRVSVGGETFEFDEGDAIRTEVSKKYTPELLREVASPFVSLREWFDPERLFLVAYLEVPGDDG